MLTPCISPNSFSKTSSARNTKPKDSNVCELAEDEKWLETPATTAVSENMTTKMMISFNLHCDTGSFDVTLLSLSRTCNTKPKISTLRMKPKQAVMITLAVLLDINVAMTTTRLDKTNITSNLKE